MSVKFLNKAAGSIDPDDVLYMRVSEMYLIEAEALARAGGQDAAAAKTLFDLVSKRDAAYVQSTKTGWFDMLRYDEALDRTGTGASESLYQKGFSQAKPSENVNWVFQIPQNEIDANPQIGTANQNPSKPL